MSERSQRLSRVRHVFDDLVEANKLVDGTAELLAQRNAVREQLHDLGIEVATKRQAVAQEVAAFDADLTTRQRGFADEIARMEHQTTTAKAEQARTAQETSLSGAARADGPSRVPRGLGDRYGDSDLLSETGTRDPAKKSAKREAAGHL